MLFELYPALDAFLLSMPGSVRDFQPVWQWDRYLVGGRQFAGLCRPGAAHAAPYAGRPLLSLKADPAEGEFYRRQYPDILPGFYSDKRTWISICLDGTVPWQEIQHLASRSYQLVFARLTKKAQHAILRTVPGKAGEADFSTARTEFRG